MSLLERELDKMLAAMAPVIQAINWWLHLYHVLKNLRLSLSLSESESGFSEQINLNRAGPLGLQSTGSRTQS